MIRHLFAGIVLLSLFAAHATAQNSTDVEQGKKLFDGMCARCHGFDGVGGEGPNLNKSNLSRAADDDSLRKVIRDGIASRGMPRPRTLSPNELRQLVSYVRSLGRVAASATVGNSERGSAIYQRSGCVSCHIIKGDGGSLGPELTQIGARRAAPHLRQAIVDPGAALPRGVQAIPGRGFDEFLVMRVVTRDGREIRSMRINEDTFTLQLRDANNQFHSFRKSDVQRIEKEPGKSLMPSFKDRLTGSELDDLVTYLLSLEGVK